MANPFSEVFQLFFPQSCPACGKALSEGEGRICLSCRYDMPLTGYARWHDNPVFKKFGGLVPVCEACSFFFFARKSPYREMIHDFKYRGHWNLSAYLGSLLGNALREGGLYGEVDLVMPVPLHPRRRLKRGYNQAEYLARAVAQALGRPLETRCLKRRVHNPSQAQTRERNDRWENVEGIFALRRKDSLVGRHVLLVDDVLTTGATLISCAETLLKEVPEVRVSIATLAVSAHELFGRHKQGGL